MLRELQPFLDRGFISLVNLPGKKKPTQEDWFRRCSRPDYAGGYEWLAFLDLDEFLVVLDRWPARLPVFLPPASFFHHMPALLATTSVRCAIGLRCTECCLSLIHI